jgi:hypothetical protein
MNPRATGLLLFLPVPVVLVLFTRLPLGVPASVALGTAVMLSHRWYARPFALRHAPARCLWCGARLRAESTPLVIDEPFGRTDWRACGEAHADRVRRMLGWAHGHALVLKIGILGTLAAFLVGVTASAYRLSGPLAPDDWVAFFRGVVGLTVLSLGWTALRRPASGDQPLAAPFPVHIQALIGSAGVLWLFRLVGPVWLVLAVLHLAPRLGA